MDNKVDKGFEKYFASLLNEEHKSEKFIEIRNKGLYGIKGNLKNAFKAGQEDRDREMEKCKQAAIRHGNMFDEFFNDVGTLLGIEKEVLELGDPQYIYETISKNTAEIEELKGTIRSQSRIDIAYQKEVSKLQAEIKLEQSNAKEAEKCATRLIDKLDKAVEILRQEYESHNHTSIGNCACSLCKGYERLLSDALVSVSKAE